MLLEVFMRSGGARIEGVQHALAHVVISERVQQ
jgi:hypothetical protein